ncbi:hypothetical protein DYU11_08985 [Fibrisoma montanum]|uniref:Uncharacterized protein n=1 Tax=Fibrisoma montanum TaxID=2305895 RepID=A0A418MF43_9BACT|nr:tetratricopeptide repeat protein [Fibrisoma montanum]RIV25422.1 hypothetical protein DYU11_08985 [Fibrisoma montanum]
MPTFSRTKWLLGCLILSALPVYGQTEQTFHTYFDQGQRYEQQGNYRKAFDAYGKALSYASATNRTTVQQAINHVDELIQQQMLVIESHSKEIRHVLTTIVSKPNRDRIQNELISLQQREDANVTDYKALLRKVKALKQVETNIANSEGVVNRPIPSPTSPNRSSVRPKPTLAPPPPKTITSSIPSTSKEGTRSKDKSKSIRLTNDKQY